MTDPYQPGRMPNPGQPQTRPGTMQPRNDIADGLLWLAGKLPGAFGDFLRSIAKWFEDLDPDGTKPWSLQAACMLALNDLKKSGGVKAQGITEWLGINECLAAALTSAQQDFQEAGLMLAQKVPQRLQEFITCWLSQNPQARTALAGQNAVQLDVDLGRIISCALPAAMTYFRTRDITAAATQFISCMFTGGGGGGGGTTPPPNVSGPFHETVNRCP